MNHVKLIVERNSVANQLLLTCNTATHTTKETKLLTEEGGAMGKKYPPPRNLNINDVIIKMYNFSP